jgi:inosine/xanthosine triphosphate pyrophosphatase family protein
LDATTAELSPEYKNRVSHRGQALLTLAPLLRKLLGREA